MMLSVGVMKLKILLCDRFEFPILRIKSQHLVKKYKSYDLLSWFVEHWFLAMWFDEAQRQGQVPWDEPYDPMMIISLPGRPHKFPMWLSSELRIKIQQLQRKGKIQDPIISHWIGVDQNGHYHGLSWICINSAEAALVEVGMRKQRFPISECELLIELLAFLVFERLEAILSGKESAMPIHEVHFALSAAATKYNNRAFGGSAKIPNLLVLINPKIS